MTVVLSLLAGVLVVLAITAATGYFVAQEFAYMSVDRSRLGAAAEAGDAGAQRALAVTKRTSFMLSGAQLGITVTGLLVGYVAEPLIGEAFGAILGGVGIPTGVGIAIGTVLALVFATGVQMLFGELFPKNLAIARPEPVARWLSRSTLAYLKVTGWLIWVFDASSNALLKVLKIEPVHDVEHSATARDLSAIVAESRESGDLPEELSMLLDRVLDFPTRDVEHAMIPRGRVDVVAPDLPLADLRVLMSTGHSRYPVVDETHQVVGVVHLVDLLDAPDVAGDGRPDGTAGALARPALLVPTAMRLPDVVAELVAHRQELACVVDEYGGFDGVITGEDLAEELVGEIVDEHDVDEAPAAEETAGPESSWTVSGDLHLDEIERTVGVTLPAGRYQTLSGLIIAELGRLPHEGTVLDVVLPGTADDLVADGEPVTRRVRLDVLEIDQVVPSRVQITLVDDASTPADPADPASPATEDVP